MTARLLASLLDRHGPPLILYARQWCPCPEDVVQDCFGKLATLPHEPTDPVAWLYRAVRNRAIDLAKSARRRSQRESAVARSEIWFESIDDEEAQRAVEALKDLPLELRDVIVARIWGGLTLEQIAQVADCSISTAFRRYEAGIAALQLKLGALCPPTNQPSLKSLGG